MLRARLMLLLCLLMSAPAGAQDDLRRIGAFVLPDDFPDTIILADDITEATPLDFFRALQARPDTNTVALLSGGGSVYGALNIAIQVHESGMTTIVPKNAWCYSACAYIFLAGRIRKLEGELGVHQISTEGDLDLAGAQVTLADILDALETFDVDPGILSLMFRTAADDIHVFSAAEIARFGIESDGGDLEERATAVEEVVVVPDMPGNVTVVQRNGPVDLRRFERLITVVEPVALSDLLRRNGFSVPMIEAIETTLAYGNFFDMGVLPKDFQIRILMGPARSSESLIPYRLSFYAPTLGRMTHYVSVALTDSGQFVLGLEPQRRAEDRPGDVSIAGKQDRAIGPQ